MPPKKEAPVPVAPAGPVGDSSKFSYIVITSRPELAKIRVNTNCQTDLAMNWTRQQFIIILGATIATTDAQEEKDKLIELKSILADTTVESIELQDEAGNAINIQHNLKKMAADVLKGRLNYKLCLINPDKSIRTL